METQPLMLKLQFPVTAYNRARMEQNRGSF